MQQLPVRVRSGRAGLGAAIAIALTIGLAFLAALLGPDGGRGTRQRPDAPALAAGGATPSSEPTPMRAPPGSPPAATPAVEPRLQLFGNPITERLLVDAGGLRYLDLTTGKLGPVLVDGRWPSQLLETASGFVCVCVTTTSLPDGDRVTVRATILDRAGKVARSRLVGSFRGYDDALLRLDEQAVPVAMAVAVSGDERTLYLGLSIRGRDAWTRSLLVVDLGTGATRQRLSLDRLPLPKDGITPGPREAWPPQITLSSDGRHAVVSAEASIAYGDDRFRRWSASLTATRVERLSEIRPAPTAVPPECGMSSVARESYYSLCGWGGELRLIRATLDGSVIGETALDGIESSTGFVAQLLDPTTNRLYLWNTSTRALVVLDPASGTIEQQVILPEGRTGSRHSDVLGALVGRLRDWIAPAARAKILIDPALALSPDGRRLYALGMILNDGDPSAGRSSGIYVVDTATLALVDRWAPTADLMSIATSADGRFLYAAGMAGMDASGQRTSWPASVTAYDATTGAVRLIAGGLGTDWVVLRGSTR